MKYLIPGTEIECTSDIEDHMQLGKYISMRHGYNEIYIDQRKYPLCVFSVIYMDRSFILVSKLMRTEIHIIGNNQVVEYYIVKTLPDSFPYRYLKLSRGGYVSIYNVEHDNDIYYYDMPSNNIDIKWESLDRNEKCVICLDDIADIFLWCDTYHVSICKLCSDQVDKCPTCDTNILLREKIIYL